MAAARGWKWLHKYINERSERAARAMQISRVLECDTPEAIRLEKLARDAAAIADITADEAFERIIKAWEKQGE